MVDNSKIGLSTSLSASLNKPFSSPNNPSDSLNKLSDMVVLYK